MLTFKGSGESQASGRKQKCDNVLQMHRDLGIMWKRKKRFGVETREERQAEQKYPESLSGGGSYM